MMKASEIMTKDVVTIRGSATVAEAIELMKIRGYHTLVVERRHEQDAYGIVTESDIVGKVAAFGKDPKRMRVYEIMTKPCISINPDLGVEYVARLFINTGIHSAPVIQGKLLGLVTMSDILHKSDFVEQPKEITLSKEIQKAIENARAVCAEKGAASKECVVAWEVVEELQAEASHQQARTHKSAFEEYCEEFPEALEARMYDV
ncbi:MAG: CP12 domain-containing protein [Leptodesmis sp.]|uniref:CP12 domain-containing protein n=1 Tax=Leptodesmis sp. TaxID=3100501 RepID=UPI003D097032